jgi:hypothetical protein
MALLRKLLLVALPAFLVAPISLLSVGCAEDPSDPSAASTGDEIGESSEDASASANSWQHQADFNLSCDEAVANTFTKKSRRHFYSYAGVAGQSTTFTFDAGWTASWGARAYVTDVDGKVIGTANTGKGNDVSVTITFPADGKYFVYVSANNYKAIKKDYDYTLTSACAEAAKPTCATVRLTDGVDSPTFYAAQLPSKAAADEWLAQFSSGEKFAEEGICGPRACTKIYKPVCGVIKDGAPVTYGNFCMIESAIAAEAGQAGESKGFYTDGACVEAPTCNYESPTRHYVVQDKETCKLVKYRCAPNQQGFSDDCGCGCEDL